MHDALFINFILRECFRQFENKPPIRNKVEIAAFINFCLKNETTLVNEEPCVYQIVQLNERIYMVMGGHFLKLHEFIFFIWGNFYPLCYSSFNFGSDHDVSKNDQIFLIA